MLSMNDFGHVKNPDLRRLVAYWLDQRGSRCMPARADIDPIDIPWILSRLWLCDFLPESRRFKYRLAGEEINRAVNRNLKGRYLDEVVISKELDWINRKFQKTAEGPFITHDSGRVYLLDHTMVLGERIILPLSGDGETTECLLGATVCDWGDTIDIRYDRGAKQETTFTPIRKAAPVDD
jgi:hypothetical protein